MAKRRAELPFKWHLVSGQVTTIGSAILLLIIYATEMTTNACQKIGSRVFAALLPSQ